VEFWAASRWCSATRAEWWKTKRRAIGSGLSHTPTNVRTAQSNLLGDGPLRDEVAALVVELGVSDAIILAGFESDRQRVMNLIGSSHLMLPPHHARKSALFARSTNARTPILGYETRVLHGPCRAKTAVESMLSLATLKPWQKCSSNSTGPAALAELVRNARLDGKQFSSREVFHHRSDLIKRYL